MLIVFDTITEAITSKYLFFIMNILFFCILKEKERKRNRKRERGERERRMKERKVEGKKEKRERKIINPTIVAVREEEKKALTKIPREFNAYPHNNNEINKISGFVCILSLSEK